jgi:ABC-type uncharacterized transport system permease subunit
MGLYRKILSSLLAIFLFMIAAFVLFGLFFEDLFSSFVIDVIGDLKYIYPDMDPFHKWMAVLILFVCIGYAFIFTIIAKSKTEN